MTTCAEMRSGTAADILLLKRGQLVMKATWNKIELRESQRKIMKL